MFRHLVRLIVLLVAAVCVVLSSCDVKSPDRVVRAPVIRSLVPPAGPVDVFVGDSVAFAIIAEDPNDEPLRFYYELDSERVAEGPLWTYFPQDSGMVEVSGHVENSAEGAIVRWRVNRVVPVNEPPVIDSFDPLELFPTVISGDPIEFSITASDPDNDPLSYIFTINDSVVTASNQVIYSAGRVGLIEVRGIVSDGEAFAAQVWQLNILAEPDSILPAVVNISSINTGTEPGELMITWSAVGEDDMEGLPSTYLVRTSFSPIEDEDEWAAASQRPGSPPPAQPGQPMAMAVTLLKPAHFVYVSVRAQDDFGNLSPLGNTLAAWSKGMEVTGTAIDALTGDPIAGVTVAIATQTAVTDVDGYFEFLELPESSDRVRVWDETVPGDYGDYFDLQTDPYVVTHDDQLTYYLIPNVTLQTQNYSSFLEWVLRMSGTLQGVKRILRTWDAPVNVYVPEFSHNGLDYRQVMVDGMENWERLVGVDLFKLVDTQPAFGFFVEFTSSINRDNWVPLEVDEDKIPLLGRIQMRLIYGPSSRDGMFVVGQHELGHALSVEHSFDGDHLMNGGQLPPTIEATQDEVWLLKVMYRLPTRQNMAWYLFD